MFTLALHAAAPHNAAMNIRLFLGGLRLPTPSRGWGRGETRFPHTPRRGRMFTLVVHAAAPHNAAMNIRLFLGGLRPPTPSRGWGPGCAGLRPASAGVWGNRVSPHPSPRAYVHVSRPCGSAAQRRNEKKVVPGRAAPSQTLPRVGAWGNRVSPYPSPRAYVHVRKPAPLTFELMGLRPPGPSPGAGTSGAGG